MHNALFTLTKTYEQMASGWLQTCQGKSTAAAVASVDAQLNLTYVITEGGVIKDKCHHRESDGFGSTCFQIKREGRHRE